MIQDEENYIPQDYLCPISQELMTDPVIAADGHTYNRESITKWLSRKTERSPLNNSDLPHTSLLDNLFARKIIREYEKKSPEERDEILILRKCLKQKEEMIKTLLEKIDEINIKQNKETTDVIFDLKKETLKEIKQIIRQAEMNLVSKKENDALKNQQSETNINIRKLQNKEHISIDVKNFKKCSSHISRNNNLAHGILELGDGLFSCWTFSEINVFKYNNRNNLKILNSFPVKSNNHHLSQFPIKHNENFIFTADGKLLIIWDKNFKQIESFQESSIIWSLCNISEVSFVIGLEDGAIKIFTKNQNTQKYEIKEYKCNLTHISALLYLSKQNILLLGSFDETINVFSMSERKLIKTLTDHCDIVTSLISLNEETFASGSHDGEIKIWSIKVENCFECIQTIIAHEKGWVFLHILTNDFIVSTSYDAKEFKIWDLKTYECLKTCKEETCMNKLIVDKNNSIITATQGSKVNIWKISK
jgi:WD40 repeat protein